MRCSICKGPLKKYINVKNPENFKKFLILKCNTCDHKQTLISKKMKFEKYYNPNYYGRDREKFSYFFEKLSIATRIFRIKNLLFEKNKRILDIGFGRGIEISILKKKNKTFGVEINDSNFKRLKKLGIETFLFKKFIKKKFNFKFDYIMLWHNLEHQKDINVILNKCSEIMKKNGSLIIEVPNSESLQSKLDTENWIYWDVPRHIHHFSLKSIIKALKKSGFLIKKINTFSLEYGAFGMVSSLLNIISSKKNLLFKQLQNNNVKKINKIYLYLLLIFSFILSPLALIIELIASYMFKNGAVLNIVAKKNE